MKRPTNPNQIQRIIADFHARPALYLSSLCGVLFVVFVAWYFESNSFLIAHIGAVFLELCLAILFIEEIIKPKVEDAEMRRIKRAKKQSFLRKLLRYNLDTMVLDYMQEFEDIIPLFPITNADDRTATQMAFIDEHAEYLTYFDTIHPFHGKVLGGEEQNCLLREQKAFLLAWEEIMSEGIENVQLVCPKPQYTPSQTWDYVIELYTELKSINHEVRYLKQNITPKETLLKLYFAGVKAFTVLYRDLVYFDLLDESVLGTPENKTLAVHTWQIWGGRQL